MYVGDFKLAGVSRNLEAAWKLMTDAGLQVDKPTTFGQYLGCGQRKIKLTQEEVDKRLAHVATLFFYRRSV